MLVGAGAAAVVCALLPQLRPWLALPVAAVLATLPDADFVLGLATGKAGAYHGTFTHSITATLVVALFAGVVANWRWGVLAGAGYGSHLLVDLLDERGRTNVLLAWPWTSRQAHGIASVFPTVPFDQGYGIRQAIASLFRPEVFKYLLVQTGYGLVGFLLLLGLAWVLRQTVGTRPESA
jgi:membrane-bound metal-dependent hydrolase YbcI (DUF457 family)